MCVTFLYLNNTAEENEWKVILINNRDEYLTRPTSDATWSNDGSVLCGTDLQEGLPPGGTWLAISNTGRIGNLLNFTQPHTDFSKTGRGSLVKEFVTNNYKENDAKHYCEQVMLRKHLYNGFNLLCLEFNCDLSQFSSYYCNNIDVFGVEKLENGIYGFGNSSRHSPFHKVQYGLNRFQQCLLRNSLISDEKNLLSELFDLLDDKHQLWPDNLIDTQSGPTWSTEAKQRKSAIFVDYIKGLKYMTRTQTVILIDGWNKAKFLEKTVSNPMEIDEKNLNFIWSSNVFEFKLEVN